MRIVLSTDTPIQMEASFINEKCDFWVKDTVIHCPQNDQTQKCVLISQLSSEGTRAFVVQNGFV
jgi:hypothetical protein